MNPKRLLAAVVIAIVLPVLLAYLYHSIPLPTWLAAAVANSVLAMILLVYYRSKIFATFLGKHDYRFYLPSLGVLIFCFLAIYVTSFYASPQRGVVAAHQYLWISWIPLIEEVVFRFGIGGWLRGLAGNFWGSYCSVVCFALAHSLPLWERITAGEVGVSVGPLLLGAACEFLYVRGKSLLPCITLHIVCNSTVPLFIYFDQRWLDWLSIFFQTSR